MDDVSHVLRAESSRGLGSREKVQSLSAPVAIKASVLIDDIQSEKWTCFRRGFESRICACPETGKKLFSWLAFALALP